MRIFCSLTLKPALTLALCAQNWIIPDYPHTSSRGLPKRLPTPKSCSVVLACSLRRMHSPRLQTKTPFRQRRKGACAQNWIRTSTPVKALRPEHSASTNFAIWADSALISMNTIQVVSLAGQQIYDFSVFLPSFSLSRKQTTSSQISMIAPSPYFKTSISIHPSHIIQRDKCTTILVR